MRVPAIPWGKERCFQHATTTSSASTDGLFICSTVSGRRISPKITAHPSNNNLRGTAAPHSGLASLASGRGTSAQFGRRRRLCSSQRRAWPRCQTGTSMHPLQNSQGSRWHSCRVDNHPYIGRVRPKRRIGKIIGVRTNFPVRPPPHRCNTCPQAEQYIERWPAPPQLPLAFL